MRGEPPDKLEARLREALTKARKARDATAVASFRSAIAAIDNARAVEAPDHPPQADVFSPIAGTAGSPGAAEIARRELNADDLRALLEAEIEERRAAARTYEDHGQDERAADVKAEGAVLSAFYLAFAVSA